MAFCTDEIQHDTMHRDTILYFVVLHVTVVASSAKRNGGMSMVAACCLRAVDRERRRFVRLRVDDSAL